MSTDDHPTIGTTISGSEAREGTDIVEHALLMKKAAADLTVSVYDALVSVRSRLGLKPLPAFDEFAQALLEQSEARGRARAGGPTQTFIANDGTATHGAAALKAFDAHRAGMVRRGPRPATGRAPREARNARRRGSHRTSSPTRAGPDPDDGGSDPPSKTCQLPGCSEPAKRKYCTKKHAATGRKRRERAKQRQGGVLRFSDRLLVEDGWDRHRKDPYRLFDTELWRGPGEPPHIVTLEELKARAEVGCRCNGANGHRLTRAHTADQKDETCFWCGHWCYGAGPKRPPAPFYGFLRKLASA